MDCTEEEKDDDVERLFFLCEYLDLFNFLLLLWDDKEEKLEELEEEEDEENLYLLFLDFCFGLGWSLLLSLFRDVCLLGDTKVLIGRLLTTLSWHQSLVPMVAIFLRTLSSEAHSLMNAQNSYVYDRTPVFRAKHFLPDDRAW